MKFHSKISATLNGKPLSIDVEEYTRGGSKSPSLLIFIQNGKRYVPYARKGMQFNLTLTGLFKMTYSETFEDMLCFTKSNILLSLLPKIEPGGAFYTPIILGVTHGVSSKNEE